MREDNLILINKGTQTSEPVRDHSPFLLKITFESIKEIQQERELLEMRQEQGYQSFLRIECL